jgi:hypothetical protein
MPAKSVTPNQCTRINARGRRCRLLISPDHDSLCTQHLRQVQTAQPDPEALAAELLDSTGDLTSAGEVNAFLANVVKLRARKLIDRKDAVAFGYLSQLLLWTLPGMERKLETESDAIEAEELNRDIAEMRAHVLAKRAANAAEASRKSQNNSSAGTGDSLGQASPHAPSSTPTSPVPAAPQPPRDYASMRT